MLNSAKISSVLSSGTTKVPFRLCYYGGSVPVLFIFPASESVSSIVLFGSSKIEGSSWVLFPSLLNVHRYYNRLKIIS